MKLSLRLAIGLTAVAGVAEIAVMHEAFARGGGGSNVMNSPGYQRRLQESRGYVTNRSTSIVTPPVIAPRFHDRRERRRR